MEMKRNWMKYGVVILISSLFYNCIVETIETEEHIYINNTGLNLTLEVYPVNEKKRSYTLLNGAKLTSSYSFKSRQIDSFAQVIFDDQKVLIYYNDTKNYRSCKEKSLYCFDSYEHKAVQLSKLEKKFMVIYTFTREDYKQAVPMVLVTGFVGSAWRCSAGAGLQEGLVYTELRFVSEATVEGWALEAGATAPERFFTGAYSMAGQTIEISNGQGDSFTATLDENNRLHTNIDNEGSCVFEKQ